MLSKPLLFRFDIMKIRTIGTVKIRAVEAFSNCPADSFTAANR
ncbi:MAG: hypothetical protein PWP31_1672 [Clostridia bacterium]|nr:hypothetical protein [Clostridia bacterium]